MITVRFAAFRLAKKALPASADKLAVDINHDLVEGLRRGGGAGLHIHEGDFLRCNRDLGTFDRIVRNPPFADAADIIHAVKFLKPGGWLVALCVDGPRQDKKL